MKSQTYASSADTQTDAAANCSGRHSLCSRPQTCPRHLSAQAAPPSAVAELGVVSHINPPRLMFTIGRDREKEHARKFLGASSDPALLESVIDAVHNLLQGLALSEDTFEAFRRGFVEGRSGTWESTGSWLTKTVREFPALSSLWHEFAAHQSAQIRFRTAAHLTDMPEADAQELLPILLADKSAKVRSKASGDMHSTKWAWAFDLLRDRRQVESDSSVIDSLDFALASRSSV